MTLEQRFQKQFKVAKVCKNDTVSQNYLIANLQIDLDYRCGQFSFKDGSSYNGEWYLGKVLTSLIFPNVMYSPTARKRHGKGTFTAFGNTYTGSWVNDRRHGQGKMTYFNGAQYEGNWEHDLPRT